ncbi:MAG: hypothetical protein KGY80_13305 [Candidatus Thorarchaeota archaeon]|nr:hypothetical protein [Candidatus Thorarchaeota archaeon]
MISRDKLKAISLSLMTFCLLTVAGVIPMSFSSSIRPQNAEGPVFYGVGNLYSDTTCLEHPINVTLDLFVDVFDPDGIDAVIGSYRNSSGGQWSNITMTFTSHHEAPLSDFYTADGPNFTLDPEHSLIVWDIKYYANDTLGNWNVSQTVQYWYNGYFGKCNARKWWSSPVVIVGLVGAPIIVAAIVVMFWKRREETT